jgi:hypothetical protein
VCAIPAFTSLYLQVAGFFISVIPQSSPTFPSSSCLASRALFPDFTRFRSLLPLRIESAHNQSVGACAANGAPATASPQPLSDCYSFIAIPFLIRRLGLHIAQNSRLAWLLASSVPLSLSRPDFLPTFHGDYLSHGAKPENHRCSHIRHQPRRTLWSKRCCELNPRSFAGGSRESASRTWSDAHALFAETSTSTRRALVLSSWLTQDSSYPLKGMCLTRSCIQGYGQM